MSGEPHEVIFPLVTGADPRATLGMLWQGPSDPQMRIDGASILRAGRYDRGTATLKLALRPDRVVATAWGDGARDALEFCSRPDR